MLALHHHLCSLTCVDVAPLVDSWTRHGPVLQLAFWFTSWSSEGSSCATQTTGPARSDCSVAKPAVVWLPPQHAADIYKAIARLLFLVSAQGRTIQQGL